jgi:hypothetical protein
MLSTRLRPTKRTLYSAILLEDVKSKWITYSKTYHPKIISTSPTPLLLKFDASSACTIHGSVYWDFTVSYLTSCKDDLIREHSTIKFSRTYSFIFSLGRY